MSTTPTIPSKNNNDRNNSNSNHTSMATTSIICTATAAATTTTSKTNTIKKQQQVWRCDVCLVKSFYDFHEACRHEEQCLQQQKEKEQQREKLPKREEEEKENQQQKQKDEIEQQRRAKKKIPNSHKTQIETTSHPTFSLTKVNNRKQKGPAKVVGPKEDKAVQQQQQQIQEALPRKVSAPTKSAGNTSKNNMNPKAETTTPHAFFAPRQKTAAAPKKTSCAMPHAFFQPRTISSSSASHSTTQKVTVKNNHENPPKTSASKKQQQQPVLEIDGDSDEVNIVSVIKSNQYNSNKNKGKNKKRTKKQHGDDDDNGGDDEVQLVQPSAPSPTKKRRTRAKQDASTAEVSKPLAGLFAGASHQQLVAEQRQAEFQAQRRLQRQKELERLEKKKQSDNKKKETPFQKEDSNVALEQPQRSWRLPLDLCFPVPNHVFPSNDSRVAQTTTTKSFQIKNRRMVEPMCADDESSETITPAAKLLVSPSALDSCDSTVGRRDDDLLKETMERFLVPPPCASDTNQLWTDHRPLVGASLLQTKTELVRWIEKWQTARQSALDRMAERHRKLVKKQNQLQKKKGAVARKQRKIQYKDDDDDFWDDEDGDGLTNITLLTGPPSSGKTALVHQVAKTCGCPVLEINTTSPRNGSALKHAMQEATQSCSSLDLFQIKKTPKTEDGRNQKQPSQAANPWSSSSDEEDEDEKSPRPAKKSSVTIILIDEVDLIYESDGDAGFWNALGALAKTAKCPIFLTAQSIPGSLRNNSTAAASNTCLISNNYQHWELQRPSPTECAQLLSSVCQQAGFSLSSMAPPSFEKVPVKTEEEDEGAIDMFAHLAYVGQCDLRRLLLELQCFAHSPPSLPRSNVSSEPQNTGLKTLNLAACRPTLESVVPCTVPVDQYSLITIHGNQLKQLSPNNTSDIPVWIGGQKTHGRVLDEHRLVVLCPPCLAKERLLARIADISVPIANKWGSSFLDGCRVETVLLGDESPLATSQRLFVEYDFTTGFRAIEKIFLSRPDKTTSFGMEWVCRDKCGVGVSCILPESPAAMDGQLQPNDWVVTIDGQDCQFWPLEKLQNYIDSLRRQSITLKVLRPNMGTTDHDGDDDDNSECQFEGATSLQRQNTPIRQQDPQVGMALWDETMASLANEQDFQVESEAPCSLPQVEANDEDMQTTLENMSRDSQFASDAALLEDLQHGLPYLSGVCRGFGFDLTENGEPKPKGDGKLQRYENSRPPAEERLFELGWKETCYFYGNSETYMTLPNKARDRKHCYERMITFRGSNSSLSQEIGPTPDKDTEQQSDKDLDALFICSDASDEDMYLPGPLPPLLESLPTMLRSSMERNTNYDKRWLDDALLERKRQEKQKSMLDLLPCLFDEVKGRIIQGPRVSRELLTLDSTSTLATSVPLDFFPVLRHICYVERAYETFEGQLEGSSESNSRSSSSRRVTRRSAKAARRHYLDSISRKLRLDQMDLTSSQVGAILAEALLVYNKPKE